MLTRSTNLRGVADDVGRSLTYIVQRVMCKTWSTWQPVHFMPLVIDWLNAVIMHHKESRSHAYRYASARCPQRPPVAQEVPATTRSYIAFQSLGAVRCPQTASIPFRSRASPIGAKFLDRDWLLCASSGRESMIEKFDSDLPLSLLKMHRVTTV